MALPEGVTTCIVIAGVPVTFTGAGVKAFVSIEPSVDLVHIATGVPLIAFIEELDIAEGVAGQYAIPHTDQAGFQDENGNAYTNWYYTAKIIYRTPSGAKVKSPKTKIFQLTTGQVTVDLDKLPGGAPALPYTAPTAKVDAFHGRTGTVTLQESDLPDRLSEGELSVTYGPNAAGFTSKYARIMGATYSVFGDSLANNGEGVAYYLAALSRQTFCFPESSYVVSHPGYTSNTLKTLTSEITGLSPLPSFCFVSAGSNDAGSGVDPDVFMANMEVTFNALIAAGVTPIVMTVPPRTGTYGLIPEYNLRLGRYAATKGVSVMDQYGVLVDPATGQPLAGLTADGIHPNAAGCKAVAARAVADVAPRFPKPLDVTTLAPSSANIYPNGGLTLDSNADGIAEGSTATLSSGFTVSLVADAAGFKWQRATIASATGDKTISGPNITVSASQTSTTLTAAATAGATSLSLTDNVGTGVYKLTNATGQYEYVRVLSLSGSGPYTATLWTVTPLKFNHGIGDTLTPAITIGDRLALAVRVRSGQNGGVLTWQVTAYNASSGVISNRILTTPNTGLSQQIEDGMCYNEFVVPAATATLQFSMKVTPVDGTYDYAMPLMYNLTKSA